jgi:SAM-dependent methyltransferase
MANPRATDWDHFWDRDQSERFRRISWSKKRIIQILSPYVVKGRRALDAGCGSGFFSRYFCDGGMQTISLDYSEKALTVAAQMTAGRARLLKADMLNDRLRASITQGVDLIFSDGLFEHFSKADQDQILANLIAVLNPGGVMATFVPNRWSPWELIRPIFMPGISESPFVLDELVDLNQRHDLNVVDQGGINVLPFRISPDRLLGRRFGMLLYTIARKKTTQEVNGKK